MKNKKQYLAPKSKEQIKPNIISIGNINSSTIRIFNNTSVLQCTEIEELEETTYGLYTDSDFEY